MATTNWAAEYELLAARLTDRGVDLGAVETALKAQQVETPSWGYADSGTRFGVFRQPGAPRDVFEKFEDAAQANQYTGIAAGVAVHIPWDTADWGKLAQYAHSLGVSVGAINPNVFQDYDYRFGSFGSERADVRARAVAHMKECVDVMNVVGSKNISLWFADGTNFPGQGDFRRRKQYFSECLAELYGALAGDQTLLVEYKPFEPSFYHTDIADWGMSYAFCQKLGPNAKVLVDLGHHLPGANIEHIVAFLLDEGRLGGFHFNNRKYADDDLTTGSINPYELYLIFNELVAGEQAGIANNIAYMIDESHTLKNKTAEMIQSLVALQTSYAKALLIDRAALRVAQESDDLVGAEEIIKDSFASDVRPLLWKVRSDLNLPNPADPLRGFLESGYIEEKAKERGVGGGSGLGA
ncbi:L-rhamnose isomerase [Capsulimonas corticalis]|uniref:L-rhamnose isomerase n=1 Tax=Capsulimonas corticalis TaxID=2219043 RepID=A0A402CV90_9BACT|nr:L-rhamnose isomerase [Capsulimonas corticalis]BDI30329.1 L-rhamnose isomerase [Capsulimonas corticalis]